MKLIAEIGGERIAVEVRREGGRVTAEVGGRRYELEARPLGAGSYLLLVGGKVFECRAEGAGAARGRVSVRVGGRAHDVALFDPKHLRGAQGAGGHEGGRAEVAAPMPGKVVRVLVAEGAEVGAGEGLVVVEAMKMQNELKSPKAGIVVEVRAAAGATVNAGDVLLVVE